MSRAKSSPVLAYWFSAADVLPHGDGRPVAVGVTHTVKGRLVLCHNALHASEHPAHALGYAPGPILWRVECSGHIICDTDKLGCRRRKYLARLDATDLLREFARRQALSVIHLWEAPDVVRRYLDTGDETLRAEAYTAAWAAAWEAAQAARAARAAADQMFLEMVEAAFAAQKKSGEEAS